MYNYYEAVKADVLEYIDTTVGFDAIEDFEEFEEFLNDTLFVDDSVTGNASGSYTFNRFEAGEYVKENIELCREMVQAFCIPADTVADKFLSEDWEYFDVSIRCYVLGAAISEALDEIKKKFY